MQTLLEAGSAAFFSLALLATWGWLSFVLGCAASPRASASLRWCGIAIIGSATASAGFWLLLAVHGFERSAALASFGCGAWIVHRWRGDRAKALLRDDVLYLRRLTSSLRRRPATACVLMPVALVAGVRLCRSLVSPPLATDSLTYHILRAGRWIQDRTWITEHAPDAAGYYEYYPPLGDALWAWAMLPVGGDALLAPAAFVAWLGVILGTYTVARQLELDRSRATLAAAALGATPCVMVGTATGYVDVFLLAMFTMGTAWAARMHRVPASERNLPILLASTALCVATGIKTTAIVPLAAFSVWVAIERKFSRKAMLMLALPMLLVLPMWIRGFVDHGNPLYPFPVNIGGFELFAGNEENTLNMNGGFAPAHAKVFDAVTYVRTLFVPKTDPGIAHLNFGWGGLALLVAALPGLVVLLRRREHWPLLAFAGFISAFVVAQLFSSGMLAHRTYAAPNVGRFLVMPLALAVWAAAAAPPRLAATCLSLAAVTGAYWSYPRGLGAAEHVAMLELGQLTALGLGLAALLGWTQRKRPAVLAALALVTLTFLHWSQRAVRAEARYAVYEAAVPAESFDPHPTDPRASSLWPIWGALDRFEGLRIAFVAGWDRRGHNWYRSPLLGSSLQNRVEYVPPTHSGEIIDYRLDAELRQNLDEQAWIDRLFEREIDVVVVAAPATPEAAWVMQHPELFSLVATSTDGRSAAFAVARHHAPPPRLSPPESRK